MISVITLTFNNPEELKKTLKSVPREDFIEHVIINGGSSEETINYLKGFYGKVINEKDSGIADAFNKGVINSSGEFIMFLNSGDVLIDKEYLKEAYNILTGNPDVDFIHSNILFKDLTGADIIMKPTFSSLGRGMPYLHPGMILRRKIFDEVGLFNIKYKVSMDFDFIVRMKKGNYNGYYRDKKPVIVMEGKGKSALREWEAIRECFTSLRENKSLSISNVFGLILRVVLFFMRKLIMTVGGRKILKKLKEIKYSSVVS